MEILVLDFDGVICDSSDETARSGWLAGSFLWPEWAKHDITPRFTREFRKLRPLLHTGFESIAILKAIEEKYSTPFIKSNYNMIMRQIFTSSQYNFDDLKAFMNRVREDWIRINEKDWLSKQRLYPGLEEFIPLAQKKYDSVYILTTREGQFASRLLKYFSIDFDEENIIGLEKGKDKTEHLKDLLALAEGTGKKGKKSKAGSVIFLDDRYLTLEKIVKDKDLDKVSLYMPCWGYNFSEERYAAGDEERISLLELEDLSSLLEN
jgi:phosphoglycolate phosphatase-like HAD superfamily hydrolase